MSQVPAPGPFRPRPPAGTGPATPGDRSAFSDRSAPDAGNSGHPAVDAALQAMANAADLPPADQIAQYEAAHQTLRETLATIDQT
ncbi:hypothetical protein ACN27G_16950 [Plantactinospora sp. WMMB334]|uniref:hypothetical protein n=1 Tax=Plantactinospora sp. WMMB334 TaxID=3404119 RepID=UPI003B95DD35